MCVCVCMYMQQNGEVTVGQVQLSCIKGGCNAVGAASINGKLLDVVGLLHIIFSASFTLLIKIYLV